MQVYLYGLVMLCIAFTAQAGELIPHAKPRSPLQISVSAAQSGLSSAQIKPGETVELKIAGKCMSDVNELHLTTRLFGGTALISGDTSWTGSCIKGEDITLLITVRVPLHGNGSIKATISTSPSSGASFASEAEYRFEQNANKKPAQLPKSKKDHKGRELREYRVN